MSNPLGNNGGRFYSSLVKPVLIDCSFVVDSSNANGLGISSLKGAGVQDVFMYTSQTAGRGNSGLLNPMGQSASIGYALVKLKDNYARYVGGFTGVVSPTSGGSLAINGSALTVGVPYQILTVGTGAAGAVTIAPVADVAGSLASTWFRLYDGYGNTFIIWFSVDGVGSAPQGVSGTLVQQSIAAGSTAGTIGTALVLTIQNLASGISGQASFTASGTTTVTVTSTKLAPLPGAPADGAIATGFTFAQTISNSNLKNWQTVGVPKGVTPAPGVSFIAAAAGQSSGGGSTGTVSALGVSGVSRVELLGNTSLSLAPGPMGGSPNVGGYILLQYLKPTNASVTTVIPGAPTDGSTVLLSFYVEQSSVMISGE